MDEITGVSAEELISQLLVQPESSRFETKRVSGKMVGKALETICAFANTKGGTLALGVEDAAKSQGGDRLFGLAENPEAVDELRRKVRTHLLPEAENLRWRRIACTLRDGSAGHLLLLSVPQSPKVHSLLDDGTWTRLDASNREMSAGEIVDAGEGVRMMFAEMRAANLFPPFYSENRDTDQTSVIVTLLNEVRPPIWEQVSDWMDRAGPLANSDLCRIAGVDTLKASKMLKRWVEQGVLLRDDSGGKRHTVYRKPTPENDSEADSSLSLPLDNEES